MVKNTKTVDGLTLRVDMLEIDEAEECLVILGKTLGPALGELASTVAGKKLLDVDAGAASGALAKLFQGVSKEDLRLIRQYMAKVTFHQIAPGPKGWMPLVPEVVFKGKLGTMYKWLWFALGVNYADFLPAVLPIVRLQGSEQVASEAPESASQTG